jgi:hypothetical protein
MLQLLIGQLVTLSQLNQGPALNCDDAGWRDAKRRKRRQTFTSLQNNNNVNKLNSQLQQMKNEGQISSGHNSHAARIQKASVDPSYSFKSRNAKRQSLSFGKKAVVNLKLIHTVRPYNGKVAFVLTV